MSRKTVFIGLVSALSLAFFSCEQAEPQSSNPEKSFTTQKEVTMESQVIRRTAPYKYPEKKILYIVSNPATLKGFPVGFFAEELTRPFFDFTQTGFKVDLASPQGGKVAFDGFSDPANEGTIYPNDLVTLGFSNHKEFGQLMENTNYEAKDPLTPFAIRDGRLITGQQQHSSALFSDLVIEALTEVK